MYKRFLSIIAALTILITLMACSSGAESETGIDPTETILQPTITNQTEAVETTEPKPEAFQMVLVDNESCTFKITGIDPDGILGYTVKIYAENKTEKDLMFTVRDVSVNGYMCDPLWASTISAGMKSNEAITFLDSNFKENGIEEVTRIDLTLNIYDSKDWTEEDFVDKTFTVYPLGEEAHRPTDRVSIPGEIILADNENCTIIVTGFEPDSTFGYVMKMYVENKTDRALMFSASNVAVNGFMCDPYWAITVAPGMRSNSSVTWFDSEFSANEITEVTEIQFPIRVYDNNNWSAEDILNETFIINP